MGTPKNALYEAKETRVPGIQGESGHNLCANNFSSLPRFAL